MQTRRGLQDWHHMLALALITAVISGAFVYLFLKVDLIPNQASAERVLIDDYVRVLFAIAVAFFGIILGVLVYSLIFFRRKKGDNTDARPTAGNATLEIAWTIIPLAIVIVLAVFGVRILDKMTAVNPGQTGTQSVYSLGAFVPGEAATLPVADNTTPELVVNVTAARFAWEFEYPQYGYKKSYVLEVPVNRRIYFSIQSLDVIHSFWVKEWGPKQDAVPGLTPVLLITPTKMGDFQVQCSQLCGYGHSDMTAPVHVVSASDFEKWAGTPTTLALLMVMDNTFDIDSIVVPAGAMVNVEVHNDEDGLPCNFSLYSSPTSQSPIFQGQTAVGPAMTTYEFLAPTKPGTYYFRSDHNPAMSGTFIVQ